MTTPASTTARPRRRGAVSGSPEISTPSATAPAAPILHRTRQGITAAAARRAQSSVGSGRRPFAVALSADGDREPVPTSIKPALSSGGRVKKRGVETSNRSMRGWTAYLAWPQEACGSRTGRTYWGAPSAIRATSFASGPRYSR